MTGCFGSFYFWRAFVSQKKRLGYKPQPRGSGIARSCGQSCNSRWDRVQRRGALAKMEHPVAGQMGGLHLSHFFSKPLSKQSQKCSPYTPYFRSHRPSTVQHLNDVTDVVLCLFLDNGILVGRSSNRVQFPRQTAFFVNPNVLRTLQLLHCDTSRAVTDVVKNFRCDNWPLHHCCKCNVRTKPTNP